MSSEVIVSADRGLIAHASIMTLLGIASGFTPPFVRAPGAALEAHTIGVLQGALLFALAAIWPALGPSRTITKVARYSALVGCYGNWIGSQLAAVWSARAMFSVTGASMPAGAAGWMEVVVGVLLLLSFGIVLMCVLILWSLRQPPAATAG